MKIFALIALLGGVCLLSTGCATPAYSPAERNAMYSRSADMDGKQAIEDIDRQVLMGYPPSRLTVWNVR